VWEVDANQCAQCSCVLKTTTTTTSTTTTSTTSTTSTTTAQGGTTTPDWWGDDDSNQWVCPLHRQCRCNANAAPVYVLDQRGCRLSCTCRPLTELRQPSSGSSESGQEEQSSSSSSFGPFSTGSIVGLSIGGLILMLIVAYVIVVVVRTRQEREFNSTLAGTELMHWDNNDLSNVQLQRVVSAGDLSSNGSSESSF